ncbi:ComF family protein [Granulosicoccaceae sp. 1_MG-2023]|nr:ComF family protein [Granulosicoccaceae sp. 1_MG-2023]
MILSQLSRLLGKCQNIVAQSFPHYCLLCDSASHTHLDLCPVCRGMLSENRQACTVCGRPLATDTRVVCGACLRDPPPFSATFACFRYCLPADYFVRELKFGGNTVYARLLGELMADEIRARGVVLPQALVPVPLGRARLLSRGFNQSAEIAAVCSAALKGPPLDLTLVRRVRETVPQSQLSQRERHRNIRNAFRVEARAGAYAHLALVDDVMTTGSTVREISRALKRAGVQRVDIWVAARA